MFYLLKITSFREHFRRNWRNGRFRTTFRFRSAAVPRRFGQQADGEAQTMTTGRKRNAAKIAPWPGATPCGRAFCAPKSLRDSGVTPATARVCFTLRFENLEKKLQARQKSDRIARIS